MAKNIEPQLKLISGYLKLEKSVNFVIPEYQRGYSWDTTKCDKLWQDIEAFIESGGSDPYFFGTIIVDCSQNNKFSLIDGQQRTTTFLLLLKALLIRLKEVFKDIPNDDDSEALKEGIKENRNKIIDILYKADVESRTEILKTWEKVKGISILENKSINEQHKDEVRIIVEAEDFAEAEQGVYKFPRRKLDNKYTNYFRNFKYFLYEKLETLDSTKLNLFAKVFLEKCQVIEIRSWQVEQAITMFNSLNSTGMPLSDADIISAQLYSNARDKIKDFNEQWESINKLASELNTQKIVNIDAVLMQFMYINRALNKEYINNDSVNVTTPGLRRYYTDIRKELLDEPLILCNKLQKIATIWQTVKDYTIVKLLLKFNENIKLYLSGYLYRYEMNRITTQEKSDIMEIGECLLRLFALLELVDAGYSSRNFKTFLFRENIKLVDKNISIQEIKQDFNKHIRETWNEESIKDSIREYDKNILVYLNEYLYSKNKYSKFDFDENVTIEHIMPTSGGRNADAIRQDAGITDKDEFNNLVNKLGNKILLEEDINKSIGNGWFKTKKQALISDKRGYKNSKYAIAMALTNYPKDKWEKDDINIATEKAMDRIVTFLFQKEAVGT